MRRSDGSRGARRALRAATVLPVLGPGGLLIDLQLPEKASIYATRDVSGRFDALLKADPGVDHWSSYVGRGAVHFYIGPRPDQVRAIAFKVAEMLGYDHDAQTSRYIKELSKGFAAFCPQDVPPTLANLPRAGVAIDEARTRPSQG